MVASKYTLINITQQKKKEKKKKQDLTLMFGYQPEAREVFISWVSKVCRTKWEDRGAEGAEVERRRREDWGAEGVEVERRRRENRGAEGAEGVGCREGCPLPTGGGGCGGAVPLPRKKNWF